MLKKKGKLLSIGDSDIPFIGKNGVKMQLLVSISALCGIIIVDYLNFFIGDSGEGIMDIFIVYIVTPFFNILIIFLTISLPYTVDAIYSNGISSFCENYSDRILKKNFVYYKNISYINLPQRIPSKLPNSPFLTIWRKTPILA